MSTKREPLLSDCAIEEGVYEIMSPYKVRDIYEAARAKDAELIETAHTMCEIIVSQTKDATAKMLCKDFLDLCRALGFKPSEK